MMRRSPDIPPAPPAVAPHAQLAPVPAGSVITAGSVWSWIAAILAIFSLAWLLQFDPPRAVRLPWSDAPLPELCGSQRLLGIDCPGCGLTRSFILSARGRWIEAWHMHPAGTAAFLFLLGLLPYRLWQGWRLARGQRPLSTTTAELLILAVLVGSHLIWWIASTATRAFSLSLPQAL